MMIKKLTLIAGMAVALSACEAGRQNFERWDIEGVNALPAPTDGVLSNLANGYLELARAERDEGDWDDAEFYLARARTLKGGTDLSIQDPSERNLTDGKEKLEQAYETFSSVSRGSAFARAPEELVTAQIAYDCWIQEQEENMQQSHVDVCKDQFNGVIDALKKKATIGKDLFILLPDEDGNVGQLSVASEGREVVLDQALAAAHIVDSGVENLAVNQTEIDKIFGATLAAKPKAPVSFVLYFEKGTSTPTPASEETLKEMDKELKTRKAAEITVIGHTDTTGPAGTNDRLSKKRAEFVKTFLIDRGFGEYSISSAGRGERELLVQTKNGVDEAKNRRAEINVR